MKMACQKCGKSFGRKYHLQRHEEYSNCDPAKRKPKKNCKVCGKTYLRTDYLKKHLREHKEYEKIHQCPHCDKSFSRIRNMKAHIRKHTAGYLFECNFCSGLFPSDEKLQDHRKTHEGASQKSTICNGLVHTEQALDKHMKKHEIEKEVGMLQAAEICEKCGLEFNGKYGLSQHTNAYHSNDKNIFDCKLCETNFENKFDLIEHIRLHENSNISPCWICKKKFLSVKLHKFCTYCKICKDFDEDEVPTHEHEPLPPIDLTTPMIIHPESEEEVAMDSPETHLINIQIHTSKPENYSDIQNNIKGRNDLFESNFFIKKPISINDTCSKIEFFDIKTEPEEESEYNSIYD